MHVRTPQNILPYTGYQMRDSFDCELRVLQTKDSQRRDRPHTICKIRMQFAMIGNCF